jgi:hypothetical protein
MAIRNTGMNAIDVLPVNDLPADLLSPMRVLPFLLTRLLSSDDALLHADYRHGSDDTVTWYVRQRTGGIDQDDAPVAVLPAGIFTSLVTRIALHADIDHHRGGAAALTLSQNGRRFDCRVFLSKCRESGYWIRLYARAV